MKEETYLLNYQFEQFHWWFRGRVEIVKKLLEKDLKKIFSLCILDFGCGTGAVMESFSRWGNVIGTDFSRIALNYCKKRGLKYLVLNDRDYFPFKEKKFDLILALDVLEHFEDDGVPLSQWFLLLKEGGFLCCTVPAFNFLWSGEDVVSEHKRRYSMRELEEKIERVGFTIQKLSYYNTFLFPIIMLVIFVRRILQYRYSNKSNLFSLPSCINRFLCFIFKYESVFLQHHSFPFGASILCLAERKPKKISESNYTGIKI